jgi:hypothetical protein
MSIRSGFRSVQEDRWSSAEECAAGRQAIEDLGNSSGRSKRELRILEKARLIVGASHYIGDGPRAWVDPDALRALRVALGHDTIEQAGQPDRPLVDKVARVAHLRADQVRRLFGAVADMVEDKQAAEMTVGGAARSLVSELEEKLGHAPTRRQVEELCLAHMSVAADLAHLADGWEDDAAEDFTLGDDAQAPPWQCVIADWQEAER